MTNDKGDSMKARICQGNKKEVHTPAIMFILALVVTFFMTFGSMNSVAWAAGSDSYYFGESTEYGVEGF